MGWIGIAGGNAMGRSSKSPYTPEQYDQVLGFFQNNAGQFFTEEEVNEESGIENLATTQAIINAQIEDPKTGVRKDPKTGKYGIPKKGKK